MPLSTAPNSALPAYRTKPICDAADPRGHAAGTVIVSPQGKVLLLRRSRSESNFPSYWALPGGGVEDGETPEQAAAREQQEEIGTVLEGPRKLLDQRRTPTGIVFHTFAQPAKDEFAPKLNGEHSGYTWADLDDLPTPMHPAVADTFKNRIGGAEDMTPEDWAGLRDGFAKWTAEEESEPEHAEDDAHGELDTKEKGEADKSHKEREEQPAEVFLEPASRKYPVKTRQGGEWKYDRDLLLAAAREARMHGHQELADHADAIRKREFGNGDHTFYGAGDSALKLTIALDRDSVRSYRKDGQLVVKQAHVTKANVCPYRGEEIPGWQKLGLDPQKIYYLLRDPEELKKAAPTLNGVQLLFKHVPVNAEDHRPYDTVGSLGTDAQYVEEGGENYLDNSLFVNAQRAIDAIENGKQRELSAGYHYTPDMTPGNFRGTAFDGIMRDIVFNHVALVEDGRAGPDVVIGDSAEKVKMARPTRFAAFTLGLTAAAAAPLLAMDQKLELPISLFKDLTSKNFKSKKSALYDGVKLALDKKLGKDAKPENVKTVLDALEELTDGADESVSEEQHKAMEAAAHGESNIGIPEKVGKEFAEKDKGKGKGFDAEPLMNFLKEKGMGEDDLKAIGDMLPKMGGEAEDEDEEERKRKEEEERKRKAQDADKVTKPAMDAAIKAARDQERAVHVARASVKPWVGEIPATMAFDSAADVYRHALKMRGVAGADKLHVDALWPVLQAQPRAGAKPAEVREQSIAMDEGTFSKAMKYAPGLEHISHLD